MVRAGIVANGEEDRIIVAVRNYIVYVNPYCDIVDLYR